MAVTYVLVARIHAAGIETFRRYEAAVLPLLADHGGRLERRLRTAAGDIEVHVVSFASAEGFAAYRDDPRRAGHRVLLETSGAELELLEMTDVQGDR
jgi:uncharacterized protein (DUF1330 family)